MGVAVAAPVAITEAAENKTTVKDLSTTLLKGRISSAGKGIAGVAVTDGINVVLTRANGNYELLSNKTTQFVYVSLPSGYEFPHENSITRFFRAIDHSKSSFISDFDLKKLAISDDKHTFIVWGDPQIQTKRDAELTSTLKSF